jgi:RNA polymerase sigma-70 factor (ECF subfamily)
MRSEAVHFSGALVHSAHVFELASGHAEVPKGSPDEKSEVSALAVVRNSETSDEQFLDAIAKGEREALADLFRRHARAVRNVGYRILRNEAEADDLVQEVFLFIFRKATLYDSAHGKASSWIIHVAYHRAFDRRRYLNSRHFYTTMELENTGLLLADPQRLVPYHEHSIEEVLGKPGMARFRSRLTPEQRETLQLFFFEGYALKEIAERTGRSLVNVRSHYYRGLERMRQYVFSESVRSK